MLRRAHFLREPTGRRARAPAARMIRSHRVYAPRAEEAQDESDECGAPRRERGEDENARDDEEKMEAGGLGELEGGAGRKIRLRQACAGQVGERARLVGEGDRRRRR